MREVIERVQAPRVALAVVMRMANAQQQGIAHDHVGMREVDLRPQHVRTVGELACPHPPEQVEILGDGTIAIGAGLPGLADRAAVLANLLLVLRVEPRDELTGLHVVAEAADLIQKAERPIIIAGEGVLKSKAQDAVRKLGEEIGALMATTMRAKALFEGHPYDLRIAGGFDI